MIKRAFDIVLALTLLILTAPLAALQALFVAVAMGRPVLFHQARAGLNCMPFRLVKFRSMRPQPVDGPPLSDAERTTALGALIRRLRLDELPQLWLILQGRMAFVGPRPLYPDGASPENRALFVHRHRVRPGLTGWAQVNGNTLLTEREKLALDVHYVDHASLLLDLGIIAMTVATVIRGERRSEANIGKALEYADRIDRGG